MYIAFDLVQYETFEIDNSENVLMTVPIVIATDQL